MATTGNPDRVWPGFESSLLDPVSIATFASILKVGKPDEMFDHFLAEVQTIPGEATDHGPWVFVLGIELVNLLASACQDEKLIEGASLTWSETEELAGSTVADAVQTASQLIELAASATSHDQSLFLNISL